MPWGCQPQHPTDRLRAKHNGLDNYDPIKLAWSEWQLQLQTHIWEHANKHWMRLERIVGAHSGLWYPSWQMHARMNVLLAKSSVRLSPRLQRLLLSKVKRNVSSRCWEKIHVFFLSFHKFSIKEGYSKKKIKLNCRFFWM